MSDEPKQPPLRLKPRLRPKSEGDESSSAEEKPSEAKETPVEKTAETKPKLRLKPRLAADPATSSETPGKSAEAKAEAPADKPVEEAPKPFRLKPRLKPDSDAESKNEEAVPAPESSPGVPESAKAEPEDAKKEPAGEVKPRFRLKPRLSADADKDSTQEDSAAPAEEKAEAPAPPLEKPAEPAPDELKAEKKSPPKFKLKKKEPEPESPTPPPFSVSVSDAEPASDEVASPPTGNEAPNVNEAEAEATPSAMPPPPLVHLKASDDFDEEEELLTGEEEEKEEAAPAKKGRKALVGLVALIVIGAGGFFGWQYFAPAEPEPITPPAASDPVATAPKPATTIPGQLVGKAQAAVAARRQGEQDRVDAVIDGKEVPESQFKRVAPAAPSEPVPQKVTTQSRSVIAPGVKATTTRVMAAIEASPEFRAFVGRVRINGVFQGSPSRALLNGHTYREGELVDTTLGIYFDHVIADRKLIVFRDSTGAIVQRKY